MSRSKPLQLHCKRAAWTILTAALSITPSVHAQRPAARPAPRPAFRPYTPPRPVRPIQQPITRFTPSLVLTRPMAVAFPRPVPIRRVPQAQQPRIAPPIRTYVAPRVAPLTSTQPSFATRAIKPGAFVPRAAWRGPSARWYFDSYLFGGAFVPDFGYWQVPANYQMLPLGFGWWPACDSASVPGRFATIGPCFGIGDYQSVAPNSSNEYSAETSPAEYYTPLEIIEVPQTSAPPASTEQPGATAQRPNMVIDLTNGKEMEVSDWWVTGGRLYFVPINGKTQSVDLDALDLEKTIDANEKRGRTFMLNFTPPDERPKSPTSPSTQ